MPSTIQTTTVDRRIEEVLALLADFSLVGKRVIGSLRDWANDARR